MVDGVGIYIEMQVLKLDSYQKFSFNMRNKSFDMLSHGDCYTTRQKATTAGIEKANEIYNAL